MKYCLFMNVCTLLKVQRSVFNLLKHLSFLCVENIRNLIFQLFQNHHYLVTTVQQQRSSFSRGAPVELTLSASPDECVEFLKIR